MAGVVGVTGEDGEGAVDLFGEDGAGEFVGQGDEAEREDKAGVAAGGVGPSVVGPDGEDYRLRAGVAETAEVSGEVLGGELLAAAVEEDEDRGGAGGLAVEPGEEGGLGVVGLGFTGYITGGASEVVRGEGGCGVRFGARAGWRDDS